MRFWLGSASAVYCRIAFTIGGVSPGFFCSISATVPETTGAENDVLLATMRPVFRPRCTTSCGNTCARRLVLRPGESVDSAAMSWLPGATRSGLRRLSGWRMPEESSQPPRVGPRELKKLTVSSPRPDVACGFAEPTVMTDGSLPGDVIVP